MSYFTSAWLKTTGGTPIQTIEDISGNYNLGVSSVQNVIADTNNSTTDNIAAGATWSGESTSTLGIVGIQFSLKTDQNCMVYFDQSPDGENWDITDSQNYIHSHGGEGWTTQAVNSFVRMRIKNNGISATTYMRAQLALCPTVEAVPRSLSEEGRLRVESHISDQNDRHLKITGQQEILTSPTVRLVGTSFGKFYDTNFWLSGGTNGGTVLIDGDAYLSPSTNAAGTATLNSIRSARFVPGSANLFRGSAKLTTNPVAGNLRRCGAYNESDGYFFQVSGTTFGVGYRRFSADTIVENGTFNGTLGEAITMNTSVFNLSIEYGTNSALYYINNDLLHQIPMTGTPLTSTLTLPIKAETINAGSAANNGILLFNISIFRLGEYLTAPTYKYIGTNTTTILKYGAGILHRIVNVDNAGSVTVYDNITAGGNVIAIIDTAKALGTLELQIPFSNGLTVVTATSAKVVVIYE